MMSNVVGAREDQGPGGLLRLKNRPGPLVALNRNLEKTDQRERSNLSACAFLFILSP